MCIYIYVYMCVYMYIALPNCYNWHTCTMYVHMCIIFSIQETCTHVQMYIALGNTHVHVYLAHLKHTHVHIRKYGAIQEEGIFLMSEAQIFPPGRKGPTQLLTSAWTLHLGHKPSQGKLNDVSCCIAHRYSVVVVSGGKGMSKLLTFHSSGNRCWHRNTASGCNEYSCTQETETIKESTEVDQWPTAWACTQHTVVGQRHTCT